MKKDIFLIILAVALLGSLSVVFLMTEKTSKINKSLEEERYSRMVAEESLQKNAAKLSTLEAQLKAANERMTKVQDSISQEKSVNTDLQKQYEDLVKVKADLEAKLQAAVAPKAPAPAEAQPVGTAAQ